MQTAGILQLVSAIISLFTTMFMGFSLLAAFQLDLSGGFQYEIDGELFTETLAPGAYVMLSMMLVVSLVTTIVFMIMGISLIAKSKSENAVQKHRKLIVTAIVFAFVATFFSTGSILLLISAVLLIIVLNKPAEQYGESANFAQPNTSSSDVPIDNVSSLTGQTLVLQQMLNNKVITEQEYLRALENLLSMNKGQDDAKMDEIEQLIFKKKNSRSKSTDKSDKRDRR